MHKTLLIAILLILPLSGVGAQADTDLLLYRINTENRQPESLALYNPANNTSTPLSTEFEEAMLSADGRLSYSIRFEGKMEVHIWDSKHPDELSFGVLDEVDADQYPLAWSPDGQKLAFTSKKYADREHLLLYLWDGVTILNLTPVFLMKSIIQYKAIWSPDGRYLAYVMIDDDHQPWFYIWDGAVAGAITVPDVADTTNIYRYDLAWSADDRLAFTVLYNDYSPSDIYVWDGRSTTNLSQSPTGRDGSPLWSADGRLAFMSEQGGEYHLLVWDGTSIKDNVPDILSFTNVAPELIVYHSMLTWTSDGRLAFVAQSEPDSDFQIYAWDGKTATNISQNPTMNNFSPVWSKDGRWAQMGDNRSLKQRFLIVRDANNQPIFTAKSYAYFVPAWSSGGNVMFCTFDDQGWGLSVWDGEVAHEVARGWSIYGRWQSGESVLCSSG